jgi:chromosome segregation ATPase
MSRRARPPSQRDPLTEAAAALADELRALEGFGLSLGKEPLTSQKSLERAATLLREAADADSRLGDTARKLVEVIGQARSRQQAFAEVINQRAHEIQARALAFQALLQRYQQLGQITAQINEAVQKVAGAARAREVAELTDALPSLLAGVDQAVEAAQGLVDTAQRERFEDVARNADTLRQQLLSARNKMELVNRRLPTTH